MPGAGHRMYLGLCADQAVGGPAVQLAGPWWARIELLRLVIPTKRPTGRGAGGIPPPGDPTTPE